MSKENNWFVHVEWGVVFIISVVGFYLLNEKMERQGQRTDKIYEMFCTMQTDYNAKWADNLKEIHALRCEGLERSRKD